MVPIMVITVEAAEVVSTVAETAMTPETAAMSTAAMSTAAMSTAAMSTAAMSMLSD
jgi:hypothetical protein